MASVNKVILIARLGHDPEIKYLQSGSQVANFSVATSEKWTDKSGEKKENVEWHRIVCFGKIAEICGQYLHKGDLCYIEGKLRTQSWDDKDGNRRTKTEIVATSVQNLRGKREESDQGHEQGNQPEPGSDEEIPF